MVIIAGDSWGCGEWGLTESCNIILHGGLGQYLREQGKNVINISKPAGSNFDSVARLEDFFLCNPELIDELEQVYVFQTEIIRDCYSGKQMLLANDQEEFAHQIKFYPTQTFSIPDFLEIFFEQYLKHFYQALSNCAARHKLPCKISIIGGIGDTLPDHKKPLSATNVILKCQSMFNLLVNDNPLVDFPSHNIYHSGHKHFVAWCRENFSDLTYLLKSIEIGQKNFYHLEKDMTLFLNQHPNRNGHQKLFDFLQDNV
jgi:hypothetical protein